jgi:putative glycosyltransferase (TIGR04372 family)
MGDPSMKPLPAMDHVIDYVHSDVRSDWMDVFLCSQCRFIIGTSSGLYLISIAFGVPLVQTNYLPWNALFYSSNDLFLPRLLWSLIDKRILTFTEILSSPLSAGTEQSCYDRSGVCALANTPEEINDIVVEMLMRLDGKLTYSASDERLQEEFQTLTVACNALLGARDVMFNCRIGKDFLREHATLLEAPPAHAGNHLQNHRDETPEFVDSKTL